MAAFTSFYVPGPAEVAVSTGGNISAKSMEFLGYTEQGSRVREELFTGNVQSDYAGHDGLPADVRLSGKMLILTMQVNRFDPAVMFRLRARYYGGLAGAIESNGVGTLLLTENQWIQVMIRSINAIVKPQYTNFERGIRVLHAFVSGTHGWDYSTKQQTHELTFIGLPILDGNLSGTIWDTDMTFFPPRT